MLSGLSSPSLVIGALLALLATPGHAVEVLLEEVKSVAGAPAAEYKLRVDGRAKFDYDPGTDTLTSVGTWNGAYLYGPSQLTRFSHKVEDMGASVDGGLSMRSYECEEGTYGEFGKASTCGNYQFGANGLDDGGLVDDLVIGPRKSLAEYTVTALTWDGETLLLTIGSNDPSRSVFPEASFELRFTAVKPAPSPAQPSVR